MREAHLAASGQVIDHASVVIATSLGARYLPAHSPNFNPIEMAFAKLKAFLRTAAARTVTGLWAAIQDAFRAFTPAECRNYLTAAGYDAYDPT